MAFATWQQVRRFFWPTVGVAVIAFFGVRHFTQTPAFRIRYSLTAQGRARLGLHELAFDAGTPNSVYLVSSTGVRRLTDSDSYSDTGSTSDYVDAGEPSIAPDGKYVAFFKSTEDGDGDVFVVRTDGTNERKLAGLPSRAESGSALSWDPTSRSVLVTAQEEIPGLAGKKPGTPSYKKALRAGLENFDKLHTQVFRVGVGGRAEQLTHDGNDHSDPVFSPDGNSIAYVRQRRTGATADPLDPQQSLWLARVDGSRPRRLLRFRGLVSDLAWLPDGRAIEFRTFGAGRDDKSYRVDARSGRAASSPATRIGLTYSGHSSGLAAFIRGTTIMLARVENEKLRRPIALTVARANRKRWDTREAYFGTLSLR